MTCRLCQRPGRDEVVDLGNEYVVGGIVTVGPEVTPLATVTVRADEAIGVEVAFEPEEAQAIVKQIGDRKIDHTILTGTHTFGRRQYTLPTRLLDMSQFHKAGFPHCLPR